MEKATLDGFLSIEGVTGVALLGRNGRPYFYRSFRELNKRQQDALVDGLFQVLESMPAGFDFFDFRFAQQRVFVYPVNAEWVLLVSANDTLVLPIYTSAISQMRARLAEDTNRALASFRQFTGRQEAVLSSRAGVVEMPPPVEPAIDEVVKAMNRLCQVTTVYLGKAVIVNYWKAARQELIAANPISAPWLDQFEVERTAQIRYLGSQHQLEPGQHALLRAWVGKFITRSEEVIRDLGTLLAASELSPAERALLIG